MFSFVCKLFVFFLLFLFFFNLIFLSRARIGHTGCFLLPVPGAIWKIKWFCMSCALFCMPLCLASPQSLVTIIRENNRLFLKINGLGLEKFGLIWRSKKTSLDQHVRLFREILGRLNKLSCSLSEPHSSQECWWMEEFLFLMEHLLPADSFSKRC